MRIQVKNLTNTEFGGLFVQQRVYLLRVPQRLVLGLNDEIHEVGAFGSEL